MPHLGQVTSQAGLHRLRRRRQARENDGAFTSLIATPHNFGAIAAGNTSLTNLAMPAPGRLALAHDAALDAEDVTINVAGNNLDFSHPALLADEIHRGRLAEETMVVSVSRGAGAPAGAFTLYLVDRQGLHRAIGTATFS